MGTSTNDTSNNDEGFFTGTFDDPGEEGFSGPAYEGQDADPSQDRREDPSDPTKTYNFNIDRSLDFYMDDQGRRVYSQALTDANKASALTDQIVQLNLQADRPSYLIDDKLRSREYFEQLTLKELEDYNTALDAASRPEYEGLGVTITGDRQVYVEDPSMFRNFMAKAGAAFANTVAGVLGGSILGGPLGFRLSQGPIGANVGYAAGEFIGQRGLFGLGNATFEANALLDPVTGEPVTQQIFNNPVTGEATQLFTTASEFAQRAAEEQEYKEKYESGEEQGNVVAFKEAVGGSRKPSWRDYVNTDFGTSFANAIIGGGALDTLSEPIRDSIVLGKIVAEGGDPLSALVTTFGDDVDEMLGLSDLASTALDEVFDPETAQFIRDNRDLAQLGADIVVYGKDPSQAIVERYGSGILDYLGADTKNQKALGQAALNVGVALDQGVERNEALGKGVIDYFRQGGTIDTLDVDSFTQPLKDFAGDLDLSFDWLSLPVDWKTTIGDFNLNANDLIGKIPNPFTWIDEGVDWDQFDWQGLKGSIDLSQFTLDDFFSRGITLDDMQDVGIKVTDIDPDFDTDQFLFDMALASEKYPGQFTTADGDYVEPLAYDVSRISDIGDDSLARKILKRTY